MQSEHTITICLGSSCFARGNKEILAIVKKFVSEHHLEESVFFKGELCTGNCEKGPVLKIDEELHGNVDPDKVYDILGEYFNI
ncbi:NAD(P)H-dependent oxidoreductase subunit E [Labilibacter marinus]|uniref:NAD(P)H-dependent oxidoreductase subunit E n=1 Tax=Labilibacter marinus TaxID=1477105 RepID=UPI000836B5A7|nr:NAD(P)H-dependent oxidoreductase subunit E [Labilibacter marinus]